MYISRGIFIMYLTEQKINIILYVFEHMYYAYIIWPIDLYLHLCVTRVVYCNVVRYYPKY